MNWATFFTAAIGGVAGGLVAGIAQVFAANLIVGWRRRRTDRREERIRAEVAKEWCENCGQRLGKDHPDICMPGVT